MIVNLDVIDFILGKKMKTSQKMQKHNNLLKTKRILNNVKMSAKGGPVFRFNLPGGRVCPPITYATVLESFPTIDNPA